MGGGTLSPPEVRGLGSGAASSRNLIQFKSIFGLPGANSQSSTMPGCVTCPRLCPPTSPLTTHHSPVFSFFFPTLWAEFLRQLDWEPQQRLGPPSKFGGSIVHGMGSLLKVLPAAAGVLSQAGCAGCRWLFSFSQALELRCRVLRTLRGHLKTWPTHKNTVFALSPFFLPCFLNFKSGVYLVAREISGQEETSHGILERENKP